MDLFFILKLVSKQIKHLNVEVQKGLSTNGGSNWKTVITVYFLAKFSIKLLKIDAFTKNTKIEIKLH